MSSYSVDERRRDPEVSHIRAERAGFRRKWLEVTETWGGGGSGRWYQMSLPGHEKVQGKKCLLDLITKEPLVSLKRAGGVQ